MKSLQSYLDDTRAHIIAQGQPAAHSIGRSSIAVSCRYLTNSGLRCAVGCHIPVPTLKKAQDHGYTLTEVLDLIDMSKEVGFFGDIQAAHDGSRPYSFQKIPDNQAAEAMATIGFVGGSVLEEHAQGIWVTNTLARLDAVAKLHNLT